MKPKQTTFLGVLVFLIAGLSDSHLRGQSPELEEITMPPNRLAHVLVVSQTKDFEHDSIPDAMANIWRMGHDSKLWETTLRSDTENITKTKKEGNFKASIILIVLSSRAPLANST